MPGYQENYSSRDRPVRGGYKGTHFNPNHHTNSHRDDRPGAYNSDDRAGAAARYNSTHSQRDRTYNEWDSRSAERAPFSERDRTSGFDPPTEPRDSRRPELLDMTRIRDRSGPGSPLVTPAQASAGGFSAGAFSSGAQTPISSRPGTSSGEKLVDELRNMMRASCHNYMLERERDAAQRNYDNTLKIYKETMGMKEAYPTSEYLARQDRDEAQATLSRLKHELKEAEARFDAKTLARYLEELVPAAAAAKPSIYVQDELAQNKRQMDNMALHIKKLGAKLNETEAECKKADNTSRSAQGTLSKQSLLLDDLAKKQAHTMTYIGKLPEVERKVNELTAAAEKSPTPGGADANQLELLRKRVVGLEGQMSNVMNSQKGLEGRVATIATTSGPGRSSRAATPSNSDIRELTTRISKLEESHKSQEAELQVFSGKLGATETSFKDVTKFQQRVDKDLKLIAQNMESFDEDVFKLSKQADVLESMARNSSPSAESRPADPDAMDVDAALGATPRRAPHLLNERAEAVRQELKVSPAVFEALGEIPAKLKGLLEMKEYLAEAQGEGLDQLQSEFNQQLNELQGSILPKIQALDSKEKDLEDKHSKLQTDYEALYNQTTALAALPPPTIKELVAPDVQANLSSAVLEDLSRKIDEVDEKYGILHNSLDTRMQNTRTDSLAHQILGSLQSAYPNLANTDEAIKQWVVARGNIEKQIGDLKKTSDKVREVVNAQGLEVQAGKKVRIEVEELARELRERGRGAALGSGAAAFSGAGVDQNPWREAVTKLEVHLARVATLDQLQDVKKDIQFLKSDLDSTKQTAEDAIKSAQRTKLDVNDKLRAFDIQLQDFREKITFEDEESLHDKLAILAEFGKTLEEDMRELKERYRSVLGKRSAATSPTDSDVPMMGNGDRKRKKSKQGKKKSYGAFIADDDDEDPYE